MLVCLRLLILNICIINFSYSQQNSGIHFFNEDSSSNLPIIIINTNGKVIPNSPKIIVDMGIIDNGPVARNYISDPFNTYNGKIAIETRGSSSQQFPKKSFAIETRDSINNDLNVSLLGLPEDNDWILYAPYTDKSFLRDILIFQLSAEMGQYASRFRFCELIINNDYMGIYILLEKIKRDKNRVDIKKLEPADTIAQDITGGYIIKVDKWDGDQNQGWHSGYPSFGNKTAWYQYHYPKPEDITFEQKNYIQDFIKNFEDAMVGSQYSDPVIGYPKYINVESFADNFILNEYARNVDGYRLSSFFYKDNDSEDERLYAGPVWDFNLAFGNANYNSGPGYSGWELEYQLSDDYFLTYEYFLPPFWWNKLFYDPGFIQLVKERWEHLRGNVFDLTKVYSQIDSLVNIISEAQVRNYLRWGILDEWVWPNPPEIVEADTYEKQISFLKEWIKNRTLWMDIALSGHILDVPGRNVPQQFLLKQNYPNPFNPQTTIEFSLPSPRFIQLAVFNIIGEQVEVLLNKDFPAGNHKISWVPKNLASGIYFYRIQAGGFSQTKKLALLR